MIIEDIYFQNSPMQERRTSEIVTFGGPMDLTESIV